MVMNGWHAGWLGCYGNEWLRTHNLDRLAVESIVFDQHFSVKPSPRGWFDSIRSATSRTSQDPHPSLLHSLRNYGVRTVRVHDLKNDSALLHDGDWDESITTPPSAADTPGEALFRQLDAALKQLLKIDRWLLWIESDRFVPPWSVSLDFFDEYAPDLVELDEGEEPQPWDEPPLGPRPSNDRERERLQATFASIVTEWDAELAEWLALFREHGLDETALWMVTSGYGLSLGERGWIGPDAARPYEELGHVPLLLRLPHGKEGGRRVNSLTASIDLLPTISDFMQCSLPGEREGVSLLPHTRGAIATPRPILRQHLTHEQAEERLLRTDDWACFTSPTQPSLLFRKPEDRWEVNDVRQQHLEWAEYLEAYIQQHWESAGLLPPLKSYEEINQPTEDNDEHSASGERVDGRTESESDLRGHQGDEED